MWRYEKEILKGIGNLIEFNREAQTDEAALETAITLASSSSCNGVGGITVMWMEKISDREPQRCNFGNSDLIDCHSVSSFLQNGANQFQSWII